MKSERGTRLFPYYAVMTMIVMMMMNTGIVFTVRYSLILSFFVFEHLVFFDVTVYQKQ